MRKGHAGLLLLVFCISIAVRLPQLGRPLSKNHEFATALVLVVMDVWEERGFVECNGSPAVTYTGQCDGQASGLTYSFMQRDGARYYISHLPLAYWLPYGMFRTFQMVPGPLGLRIFNLLLHALTAFFLYRFLRTAMATAEQAMSMHVPLVAAAFYLLMPAPLWYHGNVYMSDMVVQLPWAWSLAAGARLFLGTPTRGQRYWFLLAVFATCLTEWMGVFIAATFAGYAFLRWKRTGEKFSFGVGASVLAVAALAVGGCLWLYSGIAGWDALGEYYTGRWADRGTSPGADPLQRFLWAMGGHVLFAWAPLLLVMASGLFVRGAFVPLRKLGVANSWLLLPAIAHLFIFLRYAGHEFAVLKLGFFLCAVAAIVVVRWYQYRPAMGYAAFACATVLGVALYTITNRPGDGTATGDPYAIHAERGALIARNATDAELICVSGAVMEPQLVYYAHRNLAAISVEEAEQGKWPQVDCPIIWFNFTGTDCTIQRVPKADKGTPSVPPVASR